MFHAGDARFRGLRSRLSGLCAWERWPHEIEWGRVESSLFVRCGKEGVALGCFKDDPVDLMLRAARQRALCCALCIAVPSALVSCSRSVLVPAAMPVQPSDPNARPLPESAAPPELAVEERVTCDESAGFPVSAVRLQPALPVDYLALRSSGGMPGQGSADDWMLGDFQVLSQHGVPCVGAPPKTACKAQVSRHPVLPANAQCLQVCREISVVTTNGAEVRRWATPGELRELLVPIDTVDEALLLVHAERYSISCESDSTQVRRIPAGYEVFATRLISDCAPMVTMGYWLRVTSAGEVQQLAEKELSRSDACVGRRPSGLLEPARAEGDAVCAFLSECAYLEAASVISFERLARALKQLGAPQALVTAALEAQADEVRHAHTVAALARGRGAEVCAAEVSEEPLPELEQLALENAVEGCVRETYGAMVGALQAGRAEEYALRAAMGPIAEDELRHAALAHRVHVWAMVRLTPEARARVRLAMARAITELVNEPREAPGRAHRQLGLPSAPEAQAMLAQLKRDLWQPLLA